MSAILYYKSGCLTDYNKYKHPETGFLKKDKPGKCDFAFCRFYSTWT